jgi:Fic family protein
VSPDIPDPSKNNAATMTSPRGVKRKATAASRPEPREHRGTLNKRQEKVVARIFRAGIDGFKGGLSAENYISITGKSRATATRDLRDLIEKGAFTKTGELRHTRYHLNLAKP